MGILITGATGYIGSYVVHRLLTTTDEMLFLLMRAPSDEEAQERLWKAMQLHMSEQEFRYYHGRLVRLSGDLAAPDLGLSDSDRARVHAEVDSIVHIAAAVHRLSERACLTVNILGTFHMIQLARALATRPEGFRRFSFVSSVVVAGERQGETITEDASIDWSRDDYDPYGRSKKFCEVMIRGLLRDTSFVIFRPAMVIGDARRHVTNQFAMLSALMAMLSVRIVPLDPNYRFDIISADYVADAIAKIHMLKTPRFDTYHLSNGLDSPTVEDVVRAIRASGRTLFTLPFLERALGSLVWFLRLVVRGKRKRLVTLLSVFMPFLTWDTVFDNTRVVSELGTAPVRFDRYCVPMIAYAEGTRMRYPYRKLGA